MDDIAKREEWYQALIDECKAIITEAIFTSRWALVEGYHNLGKRITEESDNFKRAEIYGEKIVQRVALSLNISKRTLWYAIQFYDTYPDLSQVPEGKNITWKKLILKYLPIHKDIQEMSCKIKPIISLDAWDTWFPGQSQCDLLITDPPYSTEIDDIEEFAQSWLPTALSKLKSTGRAYIFIGAYPREIAAYLNVSLPNQVLIWEYRNTLGPMPSYDYILNWQAILYYRGPDAIKWKDDILLDHTAVQNIGQERPSEHQWQKPMRLAKMFIQQATDENNLVLDPFSGTGTFLLAAGSLGRIAFGCDISPDMVKIAEKRGCKYE